MNDVKQPEAGRWPTLKHLALLLHNRQATEIEKSTVADLQPDLDELVANGVLVEHGNSLGFFHQNIQDYVFSRAFVEDGRSLLEYVLDSPQDLSQRSTVRQILTFTRGTNRSRFIQTVSELLSHEQVRFHIRDVIFDVLRDDDAPTREDWDLLEPLIIDQTARENLAAWSVAIQPSWLRLIDQEGILIHWMSSGNPVQRDWATTLLLHLHRYDAVRVAVLLSPFLAIGEDWEDRIRRIVASGAPPPHPRYLQFLRDAIAVGVFDDGSRMIGDSLMLAAYEWPAKNARIAVRLLTAYLQRGIQISQGPDPFQSAFPETDTSLEQLTSSSSQYAPVSFARAVLPLVTWVVASTARDSEGDNVKSGDPWSFRHVSPGHGVAQVLYDSLDEALRSTAKAGSFGNMERILVRYGDHESLRFLLYRAWTAAAETLWQHAVPFLLESPSPFRSGFSDSPYWTTRELIGSLQDFVPPDLLRRVEARILDYFPEWETTVRGRRWRGTAQLALLEGFDERNLSDAGRRRLGELRRKFGSYPSPHPVEAGFVASPIASDDARRMTDAQWLRAIETYNTEDRQDWMKGGATELSRVLASETARQPARFSKLAQRFRPDVHPAYVDGILRGLGETSEVVAPELLFDVLRKFFSLPDRPGGRWIDRPLARMANTDIPQDIVDIVSWYATQDPDPERDLWRAEDSQDTVYYGGDPLMAGINSVRGAGAQAVSALLWPKASRLELLLPALRGLASDPTVAVRACAALALRSAFRHNQRVAVDLFLQLVQIDDILLATDQVERFIGMAAITHFADMRPIILRMMYSKVETVRVAGARQAGLAALAHEDASDLANQCMQGDRNLRQGIAQVGAFNIARSEFQDRCAAWLSVLIDDSERSVREAAAAWTAQLGSDGLVDLRDFASRYVSSISYLDDELPLLQALDESAVAVADLAVTALERLLDHAEATGTGLPRFTLVAGIASKLAVRAYTSAADAQMRERALDIVDRLFAARVPSIGQLVGVYEH